MVKWYLAFPLCKKLGTYQHSSKLIECSCNQIMDMGTLVTGVCVFVHVCVTCHTPGSPTQMSPHEMQALAYCW